MWDAHSHAGCANWDGKSAPSSRAAKDRAESRPLHPCRKAHAGTSRQILAAQVILLTTPDNESRPLRRNVREAAPSRRTEKVVLHTSGALDARVLEAVKAQGATVGSMHPLQSFSGISVPSLEGRVFAVEGDTQAVRVARQIARCLGGSAVRVAGEKKALYHAAAAMAAGNVLAVEEAAMQLLISLGTKRGEALRVAASSDAASA